MQLSETEEMRRLGSAATATMAPGGAVAAREGASSRHRTYLVVAPLIVLLILWLWLFVAERGLSSGPNGVAFEADFAIYLAAAQVVQQGGNPYDRDLVYRTERSLLQRQGLAISRARAVGRIGNPPLFIWALQPLTRFRFQTMAYGWGICLYLLSFAGFLGCLRYLGWKNWLVPGLIFVMMPQVVLGPFYGNVVCLVFGAIGGSLALLKKHPFAAGALLSLALLKPPVGLPLVALILLFHPAQRKQIITGFGAATAALFALTLLAVGWHSLEQWMAGMVGFGRDIHIFPDMAPLAGLYVRPAGPLLRAGLEALSLVTAAALTGKWWWENRTSPQTPLLAFAWLSLVWFLVSPYAHFFDEVLLTLPVLILLARDGHRISRLWPALAVYLLLFSIILISATPGNVQLLPLPLLGVAACILFARSDPQYQETL